MFDVLSSIKAEQAMQFKLNISFNEISVNCCYKYIGLYYDQDQGSFVLLYIGELMQAYVNERCINIIIFSESPSIQGKDLNPRIIY